jgi:hypothetical protein
LENFEFTADLKYNGAYFMAWGIILFIVVLMVILFKRKKGYKMEWWKVY